MLGSLEWIFLDNWVATAGVVFQNAQADAAEFRRSQNVAVYLQAGYGYSF
jgi:hypothetical protein